MRTVKRILGFCLFFLTTHCWNARAADIPTIVAKLDGRQGQLVAGAQARVAIDSALNYTNITAINRVHNVITLKINEEHPLHLPSAFTVTVQYKIYFEDANSILDSTGVDSLLINYDSANVYKSRASYQFYGGYKVTVKVISVSSNVSFNVIPAIVLLNEMDASVQYGFSCTNDTVTSLGYVNTLTTGDELHVNWNTANGADEYDLEWAYVDSSALENHKKNGSFNDTLIYESNATRVTVSDSTHYRIPLLYDDRGIVFFRVRSVQYTVSGKRVEGVWSWWGHGIYGFKGHEPGLNWQASTSYAEGGKRKSVVQYFDGTLRSRQTVTKDNTLGTTVVAETFYDYQGQAVINVLPAPTLNTIIQYTQNFNVGLNGGEYDKSRYDSLTNASNFCGLYAPPMGTQSGAARYYSSDNPLAGSSFHQFIPDAAGHAFVETVFTPDNTGRIVRQSGVGETHRLGSGHETIYSYGLPSQKELDGLFGTEVGDYTHYQKNMVRDANGQYSVSYVDMNGKTIATALAGQAPAAMDTLPSYSNATVTEPLITPASNITDGFSMVASKGLLVPKAGQHRFVYSLLPDSITIANCDTANICYDCYYDLEISITNECNNNGFPNNKPIIIRRTNLTVAPLDTACNARVNFPAVDTTIQLAEGSYLVTKKLTASRWAMEYYRDSVFLRNNTCKTKEDFIREVLDSLRLQPSDCTPGCASCLSSLGTWEQFCAAYMQQSGYAVADTAAHRDEAWTAYKKAADVCTALCNSAGDDANIRKAMLWDVSPSSGQYADPNRDSLNNTFSIFRYINILVDTTRQYANPSLVYLDENGKPDTLTVNGVRVLPQQLSPEQFAMYFKASWAETLLPLHPEFCKLQKYQRYSDSHAWDVRFDRADTYRAAMDSGFLNPTPGTGSPFNKFISGQDPLFNKGYTLGGTSIKTLMENKMVNFQEINAITHEQISMWALATLAAVCKPNDATCATTYKSDAHAFDTTALCGGELDMAWRSFKSFYLTAKRKLVQQLIDSCGVINLGYYQSRFVNPDAYLTGGYGSVSDTTQALNDVQNAMAANYVANCKAYADQWIRELSNCSAYDTADLRAKVIPKLIQVCVKGSDGTHPYGSSTISPDSTYTFNSFEAVLQWYNDSLSLDTSRRKICNGYLISAPKPYNHPTVYGEIPIWTKPDSCVCAKIDELYTDYQAHYSFYSTFSAYLKAVHKTTISQGALDTLRGLCSGAITCNYLASSISLPAALQCGVSNVCIGCEQMRNAYAAYQLQFPGSVPGVDTLSGDTIQVRINRVFANFLNAQFGFSYTAGDYLNFMENCKIGRTPYQDTLWKRIADFRSYYLITPRNQIWRTWRLTPLVNTYFRAVNALLRASQNPSSPQVPEGFAVRPFTTSLNAKLNSVIKTLPNIPSDSDFHAIVPFPLQYTADYSSTLPGFVHLTTNVVRPSDFVTGTATLEQLNNKYFAVATSMRYNFLHNIWGGKANSFAYPYYGMSTPDSTFIPWGQSGFTSWENHIQSIAFYKKGQSVVDSATYITQYNDSVYVGTWWGDYGNNTIPLKQIKEIKNVRFDPSVLPMADMYQFEWLPKGIKATLEMRNGTQTDAYIFQTYGWPYIKYKEFIDTNLYNPNCRIAFANYFNRLDSTSYTPIQIDSIYAAYGITFNYCDTLTDTTKLLCGKTEVFKPFEADDNNCKDSLDLAVTWATELYNAYRDSLKNAFEATYLKKCLAAFNYESFTLTRPHSEYHYTLYYYDQAGNLVQTVPPAGVDNRMGDATFLANVTAAKTAGTVLRPSHGFATEYRYNTLNQVVAQSSPDGGTSLFWYDRLGRLAVSQNAKQLGNNAFSYTLYDALGRITEVGEKASATGMYDSVARNAVSLNAWLAGSGARSQITRTFYDAANSLIEPELFQKNLRNRVACTELVPADGNPYQSATYYSYDIHGNVDTLLQDYRQGVMADRGNRFKKMVYRYDLISGKVNGVAYQPGRVDAFYHRYEYDAENKLMAAYTSRDSFYWEREAAYSYYRHGPLARTQIGQQGVQGVDYAYTLQGWLKGINSSVACADTLDMGRDGSLTGPHRYTARDELGMALFYFDHDYKAIGDPTRFQGDHGMAAGLAAVLTGFGYAPLYNGNIAGMSVDIRKLGAPLLKVFHYDQLNRLITTSSAGLSGPLTCNQKKELWDYSFVNNGSYYEDFKYDANGNITKVTRYGAAGGNMDLMTYWYKPGKNQLDRVEDAFPASNFTTDVDNQDWGNYQYDAIGNLTSDAQANISVIDWTVYGKIAAIGKSSSPDGIGKIYYTYDPSGNRISKQVYYPSDEHSDYTWYVRDAQGNVMAVYELNQEMDSLHLTEQHLYGSSRIGIERPNINVERALEEGEPMGTLGYGHNTIFERGRKQYELTNHLGNVLVTVSDKKFGVDTDGNDSVDYNRADVVSAQDYYSFGAIVEQRKYSAGGSYRYGFNGKENDNDVKGVEGSQQDYGMRIYDPRIGRFLSVDPITAKYPELTPYQFASNRPVDGIDLDGEEFKRFITYDIAKGEFNVHIHCVIKICNVSASNADAIGANYINAFKFAFEGVYDPVRKIRYSASAEYQLSDNVDDETGLLVSLKSITRVAGKPFVAGMNFGPGTQNNSIPIYSETIDKATGVSTIRNPKIVAIDVVHELGHSAGLAHPFEETNTASDVDLTPVQKEINGKLTNTTVVSPGADRGKILQNVMMYTITTIDGVKVGNIIKDPTKLSKFSPEQAFQIVQQIGKDLSGGEKGKTSNQTQNDQTSDN